MRNIVLVAHNLRSTHNVGSILRTAEGVGVQTVYLTGYTPYPHGLKDDIRLPHLANKLHSQIAKTALGAEISQTWDYREDIYALIDNLHSQGFDVVALEQTDDAIALPEYIPSNDVAIIVGREVEGIESEVLANSDIAVQIPMLGQKESFNVTQAAAMALYHLRHVK